MKSLSLFLVFVLAASLSFAELPYVWVDCKGVICASDKPCSVVRTDCGQDLKPIKRGVVADRKRNDKLRENSINCK